MSTVLFLIASYGICFGLMNDKAPVIPGIRKIPLFPDKNGNTFFTRMLACPYCTGFHAGWITWVMVYLYPHIVEKSDIFVMTGDVLVHAFAASAFCYIADITAQWIEH